MRLVAAVAALLALQACEPTRGADALPTPGGLRVHRTGGTYVAIAEPNDRVTDEARWHETRVVAYSLGQLDAAAHAGALRSLGRSARRAHSGPPADRQRMVATILEPRED